MFGVYVPGGTVPLANLGMREVPAETQTFKNKSVRHPAGNCSPIPIEVTPHPPPCGPPSPLRRGQCIIARVRARMAVLFLLPRGEGGGGTRRDEGSLPPSLARAAAIAGRCPNVFVPPKSNHSTWRDQTACAGNLPRIPISPVLPGWQSPPSDRATTESTATCGVSFPICPQVFPA